MSSETKCDRCGSIIRDLKDIYKLEICHFSIRNGKVRGDICQVCAISLAKKLNCIMDLLNINKAKEEEITKKIDKTIESGKTEWDAIRGAIEE